MSEKCPVCAGLRKVCPMCDALTPRDVLIADLIATKVPVEQPTPRTDALDSALWPRLHEFNITETFNEYRNHARQLERENAELRKAKQMAEHERDSVVEELIALRRQLAEAS